MTSNAMPKQKTKTSSIPVAHSSPAPADDSSAHGDGPAVHAGVLALMVPVTVVLIAFIVVFGRYGDKVTSGIDQAVAKTQFDSAKKFEKLGNNDEAIRYYQQALGGRFSDEEARYLCVRSLGELLYREGRFEESVALYRDLPPEAFTLPGAYTAYASALLDAGESAEGIRVAHEWLSLAESQRDTTQTVWASVALGQHFEETAHYAEALDYFRRAVAADPQCEANLYIAQAYRRQKDWAKATAQVEAVLADAALKPLHEKARGLMKGIERDKARA